MNKSFTELSEKKHTIKRIKFLEKREELKQKMKSKEVTINIQCTMRERWVPHFLGMLQYMEQLGNLGSSKKVTFYSDGDGDYRPKFLVDGVPIKETEYEDGNMDYDGNKFYDAL